MRRGTDGYGAAFERRVAEVAGEPARLIAVDGHRDAPRSPVPGTPARGDSDDDLALTFRQPDVRAGPVSVAHMPATFHGLPTHVLIVHATVVLVPLATLATLLLALLPRVRDRYGWAVLAVDALALVSVPAATSSGEGLQSRIGGTALIERHASLADAMTPLMVAVAALALVAAHRYHRHGRVLVRDGAPARTAAGPRWSRPAALVAAAVAVVASVACLVQVVRVA